MFWISFRTLLRKASTTETIRHLSRVARTETTHPSTPLSCILFSNNPWIWQKPEPLKLPINISSIKPITLPDSLWRVPPLNEPIINTNDKIIEDPLLINNNSKEAARLIVIRRKKMKKHKLKKLRKRMKYEWAKLRQRRELKKEKEFQAGLIAQCKAAEAFSAEDYVASKIKQATAEPPPRFKDTPEYKELMWRKKLRLNIVTK